MKLHLLLLSQLSLIASCATAPTAHMADGSWLNLGASLMENSTSESATYKGKDGSSLTYTKTGKNQTTGPGQIVTGIVGTKLISGVTSRLASTDKVNMANHASDNQTTLGLAKLKAPAPIPVITTPPQVVTFPPTK